jgi:DNA-binding MarR family transcriptional regulator
VTTVGAPDETAAEIVERFGTLVGETWAHTQMRMAELGLSMAEAKAVLSLKLDGALSMRELAAAIHVSPSNVTVTVDRLQTKGLIISEGAGDRRVRGVRLSDAGMAVRRGLEQRIATDYPATRGLSDAEKETLLAVLRRLTGAH